MSARGGAVGAWLSWGALVLAAAIYLGTRLRVDADFAAFLPAATTSQQRFLVAQLKEGVAGRLLLIGLRGDAPARLADTSRALAHLLSADPDFRYVNNGELQYALRDTEILREHRYQLSDGVTPERFTAAGIRAALAPGVESLSRGIGLFETESLAEDPTGETGRVVARLVAGVHPASREGVWFDAGGGALLIAETRATGSDLDGQERAQAALERAFKAARDGSRVELVDSSPGAMAVQSRALIVADASRLALVSSLLILGILAFVYRSSQVVLLCTIPALTGLLLGAAAVNLTFGSVHAITLGFGSTLLGEAVDYPGYLLTRIARGETALAALARIARTLAMAVLTTAAAAAALLFAGFPGLAQLGLLTIVGVLVAGGVTAWALPRWVPAHWHPPLSATEARSRVPSHRHTAIVIAGLMLVAVFALAAGRPWWDDDLANLNPLPAELKLRDRELRSALGAPDARWMLLIDDVDAEGVLQSAERLRPALEDARAHGWLRGFDLVSDYLPSQAMQRRRRSALPDAMTLRANFAAAARALDLNAEGFEPFFAAVDRARSAPPLRATDLSGSALGLREDALLRQDNGRWQVIVPLSGVSDPVHLAEALAAPNVRWVDLQQLSRSLLADFRLHALAAFAAGALLVLFVMAAGLRSATKAVHTALPVVTAIAATAATLVATGHPLTVFHLVALMLVAGIGTNYALFMDASTGDPPATALRSLAVVAGTTLCAFATLATSQTPVLHAIGLTVTIGATLCAALSLLLLPFQKTPVAA